MAGDTINTLGKDVVSPGARPTSSVSTRNTQDTNVNSKLQLFRLLIGICTPSDLTHDSDCVSKSDGSASSPSPTTTTSSRGRGDNVGLYQRAKNQERRNRIAYLLSSYTGNTLLLLQIIIAAAFTGLSSYKEASPVTLTTLGALNTVVAGCLAWLKGQGVPQRYHKARDQYQALVVEIEMTERSFMRIGNSDKTDDSSKDPRSETDRLKKIFDTARDDQQANYPDLYVSTGATAAKVSKALADQLDEAKAEAAKLQADLMARVSDLESKATARVEGVVGGALKKKE